jgi:spore coat protein U-like protein
MRIFGFILCCLMSCSATYGDVMISGLSDYNFGIVIPGNQTERITQTVCIYNSANSDYEITANSANAANNSFYMLRAGGSNTIEYRVRWDGPKGGYKTLTPAVTQAFDGAITSSTSCAGVAAKKMPQLRIEIDSGWLSPMPASGNYSDTLMLTVAPV